MALFSKKKDVSKAKEMKNPVIVLEKKETEEKAVKEVKKEKKAAVKEAVAPVTPAVQESSKALDVAQVILRPHVTEKATDLSAKNVYVFEVNKRANKMAVAHAIEQLFKVKPVKVAIINESSKFTKNPRTNRRQPKKMGGKKALVYLKSGDKIEFV